MRGIHKYCLIFNGSIAALLLVMLISISSYAKDSSDSTEASFRIDYPGVSVDSIEKTDIVGLFEVQAGCNIVYYHPKTGDILFGEIITKSFENITADRRAAHLSSALKSLPLEKAIRIGRGKSVVIEFTDIDCPYCRKMEEYFNNRNDVSRYVFLSPIDKIHPDSTRKSLAVLCSDNRADSYKKAMNGFYDGNDVPQCQDHIAADTLSEYKVLSSKLCVQGTPALWVNGIAVAGANIPLIDQLLSTSTSTVLSGREVKP